MKRVARICLALVALLLCASPPFTQGQVALTNFFNFETAPVHPVALSPDGSRLTVCNLPDGRLEVFSVTSGSLMSTGSIAVGIDPVTVRFRTSTEAWVANYISDSISILDLPSLRVVATLSTSNEPSDIAFSGTRAYVSCGQPNLVQVFNTVTLQVVTNIAIDGSRPRALDVSSDGSRVYVAIFESGNASTIIGNGVSQGLPRPNAISFTNAPSGGLNPPPNNGFSFSPAINPAITGAPPRVSLIVKKNKTGRWLDDNQGDWTEYISGTNAGFTGRFPGWDIPDHDLGIINTSTFQVSYASGLMNICMAVAVNPVSGKVSVVGTDAINNIRFQSVLNGNFIRANIAQVDPGSLTATVSDLNPHLTYASPSTTQTERNKSVGDPRGIAWNSSGTRCYISGMGSDNLITLDSAGNRIGSQPVALDAGPTGIAIDEPRHRLYVYSRFAGTVTTISTDDQSTVATNKLYDPTPLAIKAGRPHLYNTHQTSGLGQAACASCHVDARFDRLAWDLGDPADQMKFITNGFNFGPAPPSTTNSFHPMKGPMTTQTLQDIITHEPFHWRGDRDGIEQFDGTFTNLQGATTGLQTNEMQDLKNFLGSIRFAPNPFRPIDNSLPANMALPGQVTLGRGLLPAGSQLPNGNAVLGQALFRTNTAAGCLPCHTLPTGLGTDLRFNGFQWLSIPPGANAAHHISAIELERNLNLPFKIPSLRNMFDKFGLDFTRTNSRSGFGFGHDGSVDSLTRFVQDGFGFTDDQATANMVAFLLTFTGSDLIPGNSLDVNRSPGVASLDTPASVGRQFTLSNSTSVPLLDTMVALANSSTGRVDLIAKGIQGGLQRGWFLDRSSGTFVSDRQADPALTAAALRGLAGSGTEQTYTLVPRGAGKRLGIDRDADGYFDRDEQDFGSDPADPLSLATNTPPRLVALSNSTFLAVKGRLFTLAFSASDSDVPAQQLTFSLGPNAPIDSSINPSNGVFTWTPSGPGSPITNAITVIVTDSGNPHRSDSNTFRVVCSDIQIGASRTAPNSFAVSWGAVSGITYRLQYKDNLSDAAWSDVSGDIVATNALASKIDPASFTNNSRFYRVIALP